MSIVVLIGYLVVIVQKGKGVFLSESKSFFNHSLS